MPITRGWRLPALCPALAAITLAGLAQSGPAGASQAGAASRHVQQRESVCRRDAMIVFDTSGSMQVRDHQHRSRLEVARASIQSILPEITAERRTGLIVFGADENCSVELRMRPAHQAGSAIHSQLDRLFPGAQTPIAEAVGQAARQLQGRGIIVLVTDGEETCGGDPCASGRLLKSTYPELTVHVIGYGLPRRSTEPAICLAESTSGRFVSVATAAELTVALREALLCPKMSRAVPGPNVKPASTRRQESPAGWDGSTLTSIGELSPPPKH